MPNREGLPCCKTCRYYDQSKVYNDVGKMRPVKGACRRDPPVARREDSVGIWPHTEPDDWCGNHHDFDWE